MRTVSYSGRLCGANTSTAAPARPGGIRAASRQLVISALRGSHGRRLQGAAGAPAAAISRRRAPGIGR